MITRSMTSNSTGRCMWLRRGGPGNPQLAGRDHYVGLTKFGHAAAYETFVTISPHMAAIWTDPFESMLVEDCSLRWAGGGPGVGRDARIAYSSLLGRCMARAYFTSQEGVRAWLVPSRRFLPVGGPASCVLPTISELWDIQWNRTSSSIHKMLCFSNL